MKRLRIKLRDMTRDQFLLWTSHNCAEFHSDSKTCAKCVFNCVNCCVDMPGFWIKRKAMFSDKFLDKTVTVKIATPEDYKGEKENETES